MLVVNILFGIPELLAALLLFNRQIMILAQIYDWLKRVFLLALGWHKYVVICFPLDPSNKKIAHDYQVSYYNDITIRSSYLLGGAKKYQSLLPSFINKRKTANNENSIYEILNRKGCNCKPCRRVHKCQKCNSKDYNVKDCQKKRS